MLRSMIATLVVVAAAVPAFGQALEVKDGSPLRFESLTVRAEQDEGVARVDVDQTFRNTTGVVREGTYTFRLPESAVVHSLSMWMDGKEKHGEVLEAGQARQVYDRIVRGRKDPALLEEIGFRTFRVSVFPIPAHDTVRIRLVYAHVVDDDLGLRDLEIPLPEGVPLGVADVRVTIADQGGTAVVDSPTHSGEASIERRDSGAVVVSWSAEGFTPTGPFRVRSTPAGSGVGLAMLTHRSDEALDGTFLVRVVPRLDDVPRVPRDVVFVCDKSGSMDGRKLAQARDALAYGLGTLRPEDRFAVLTFSTRVDSLTGDALARADADQIASARSRIAGVAAGGGTDIASALGAALRLQTGDPERMFVIVFLTDGDPTVGETDPDRIVARFRQDGARARLFAFGVGDGVKDFLLSRLVGGQRGAAEYVREDENLELKVSALFDRVQSPVMTGLALTFEGDGVEVRGVEPEIMPDAFRGSAVVVAGRYSGAGKATLRLTGMVGGTPVVTAVPVELPAEDRRRPHVTQLWARMRIDGLLEDLRVHGFVPEIRDDIVRLGVAHQVVSPYTSFLVVEDGVQIPLGGEQARVPEGPGMSTAPTGVTGGGPSTGGGAGGAAVHTFGRRSRGGAFAGPAGEVPPDSREPSDPPPPPDMGGPTSPGGETGGGDVGAGGMSAGVGGGGPLPTTKPTSAERPDYSWWQLWWDAHGPAAQPTRTAASWPHELRVDVARTLRAVALDAGANFFVRSEAQRALARLGLDDDATQAVARRMRDGSIDAHRICLEGSPRLAADAPTLTSELRAELLAALHAPADGRAGFRRGFAALTLGLRADPADDEVRDALLLALTESEPRRVRARPAATLALGLLGSPAAAPVLRRVLETGRIGTQVVSDVQRAYVVDALGRLGDGVSFGPLTELLRRERSAVVRRSVPAAVARLAAADPALRRRARTLLMWAAESDTDPTVRHQSILALGWLAARIDGAEREKIVRDLRAVGGDAQPRAYALLSLALADPRGAAFGDALTAARDDGAVGLVEAASTLASGSAPFEGVADPRRAFEGVTGRAAVPAAMRTVVGRSDDRVVRELIDMVGDAGAYSDHARGLAARALGQLAEKTDPRRRIVELFPYRTHDHVIWAYLDR